MKLSVKGYRIKKNRSLKDMKTEKTIYIKYDKYLFSNNVLFALLLTCAIVSGISFLLNLYQVITEFNSYIILSVFSCFAIMSLYRLTKEKPHHYIFINEEEIAFKQSKLEKEIRLRFEGIEYFETHFSQIVFSTTENERIILQLNKISNKQKRWEIKDFLRGHIKQHNKTNFT